jgi:hypothetical protein
MDFIDSLILEHIKEIDKKQGTPTLFCIGMRTYLVDRGLDPLKQEKQDRSKTCDRLVHTHTNLKLEQRLEMYQSGLLPWDIEMTVENPVSDDDDGPPHRVSDSESESESEQNSH